MKGRPVGVTILGGLVLLAAIVLILIGIAGFIVGLAFLIPVTPISGTTLILNGLLYFFIGIVLGVAGSGLLAMRPWAWGIAVLASLVYLVYLGYNLYEISRTAPSLPLGGLITFVIVAAVFVYLLGVNGVFRRMAAAAA